MSVGAAILTGVRDLWEHGYLHDLTIQVQDRSFKVHKLIMASVSNYFCSKLIGLKKKTVKDIIKLEGVSAPVMEKLIDFIYKGELGLAQENVVEILDGAMFLQMQTAVSICTENMITDARYETRQFYTLLSIFKKYGLTKEIKRVRAYIKEFQENVFSMNDDGISMPYDELCSHMETWHYDEYSLFQNVLQWVNADKPIREKHLNDLASRVRFCLMTPEELGEFQKMDIYKKSFEWWHLLLTKALDYHKLPTHQKILYNSEQNTVRGPPSLSWITSSYDTKLAKVPNRQWLHLVHDDKWRYSHTEVKAPRKLSKGHSIVVNNFLIVHVSAEEAPEWSVFDPRTVSWSTLAPSVEKKSKFFALVHHGSHLYVVCGCKGSSSDPEYHYSTDTIERYDFKTDKWSSFLEFPEPLMGHAACVLRDNLYVSGGYEYEGENDRVYCYNLISGAWKKVPAMLEPLCYHKMSVMRLKGDDVLTVLSPSFQLSYSCSYDQTWTRLTVSTQHKEPTDKEWTDKKMVLGGLPGLDTGNVAVNGNSVFFCDVKEGDEWRNGGVCFVMTFDESGEETTIKYLPSAEEEMFPVMMSVSRHHFCPHF